MSTRTWMIGVAAALLACTGCGGGSGAEAKPAGDGVPVDVAKQQPPPPVGGLTASVVSDGVELRWLASPDVRYRILRRENDGFATSVALEQAGEAGERRYVDRRSRRGATYEYRLVPENLWGVGGEPSPWVAVRLPR